MAARRALTDLQALEAFVRQAQACAGALDDQAYRERFCQNNQQRVFNFESLNLELAEMKAATHERWLEEAKKERPDPRLAPFFTLINREYEACTAENQYTADDGVVDDELEPELAVADDPAMYDNDDEEGNEPALENLSVLDSFFPTNYVGEVSLDPSAFNVELAHYDTYRSVLTDAASRREIDQHIKQTLALRRKMFRENPLLLRHMLNQLPTQYESDEVVYRNVQSLTGLSPADIDPQSRLFFQLKRGYDSAYNGLLDEGYTRPNQEAASDWFPDDDSEIVIRRGENGQFVVTREARPAPESKGPMTTDLLFKRLGWRAQDIERNAEIIVPFLDPLGPNHPHYEELVKITERYRGAFDQLRQQGEQLRGRYFAKVEADEQTAPVEEQAPEELYSDEDYCANERDERLRQFAENATLIEFFESAENREFMQSHFNRARDIMKDMLGSMNISPGSKIGMRKVLDDVSFVLPDVSLDQYAHIHTEALKIMDAIKDQGFDQSFGIDLNQALSALMTEPQNEIYKDLDEFDSANAFYLGHWGHNHGHEVGAGCGIALPSVQRGFPEFFMGVMAHELGHALDPGLSTANREQYSEASLKNMDELRECLIQNNRGLHHRVTEDFADHLEAHYFAHWMRTTKDDPEWPLRRQRYLLFAYSGLCEKESGILGGHSDNDYRTRHVMSHPHAAREFSEFNAPSVPFCPQLLAPSDRGGTR
jgi:hypothetical protein